MVVKVGRDIIAHVHEQFSNWENSVVAQKVVAPPVIWQHDIFTVYIVSGSQQINGVLASIPTHYRSKAELSVCNFFCLTYCPQRELAFVQCFVEKNLG